MDGGQITASDAKVQQGCIEGSNVNVVDEMVKMITISRAYQAGQKVINTVDETLDKTVNQWEKYNIRYSWRRSDYDESTLYCSFRNESAADQRR